VEVDISLFSNHNQFVILRVGEQAYALPASQVREMLVLPEVTEVPRAPSHLRGIISPRGEVLPLFDLRRRLGRRSLAEEAEELLEMIDTREQEHRQWLNELESCISEGREFTLPTDPAKCAFGQWYQNFTTNDLALASLLERLASPHRRIHEVAGKALEALSKEGQDAAQEIIDRARRVTLPKLLELFGELKRLIRETHQEIAVILENGRHTMALAVDNVDSVELLQPENLQDLDRFGPADGTRDLLESVGRRANGETVYILKTAEFFQAATDLTF